MTDISGLGGSTGGDEHRATETLRSMGFDNPSSGLVRFLAYNDVGYSAGDAARAGLPLTSGILKGQFEEAIRPAVQSYEASKPEIAERYNIRETQLAAEKQPLIDRYQNLLAELTGRETKETGARATNLAQEYGKRGISLESGIYQTDLERKLGDISQFYGVQRKDVGLSQEADLRDLQNTITNLAQERIATMREIDNAIAGLKAGAGTSAVSAALDLYKTAQEQKFQSRFDSLNRQLLERQINPSPEYKTVEFGGGLYRFDPVSGALSLLQKQVGGGTKTTETERAKAKAISGFQSDVSSGRFSVSDLIFKWQDTLSVDEILGTYNQYSPYGPYRESTDQLKQMFGF